MQPAQQRKPENSQRRLRNNIQRAGLYRSCDTILVANLGSDHESNRFFIPKRNFESLLDQSQRGVADVFET